MDTIPASWDAIGRQTVNIPPLERVPTAKEVRDILAPWRPLYLRRAALFIWKSYDDEAIRLRTHYGDGDDKFAEWREVDRDMDPTFEEDLIPLIELNDPQIFDFGENWNRVFDILPELAGPQQGYICTFEGGISHRDLLSIRQRLRERVMRAEDKEEEVECGIGMELQFMAVQAYLIVADREAFETDKLRILYLDARGNIVRHSRLAPENVWEARGEWSGAKYRDSQWWKEKEYFTQPGGTLGEKYKAKGEIGRILYDVEDLL